MWHLQLFGVRLSAQRKGVARALMEHMAEIVRCGKSTRAERRLMSSHLQTKGHGMRLGTVTDRNEKIYERLGFRREGGTASIHSPQGEVILRCMFKWSASA